MADLVIKSNYVVTPYGVKKAFVLVTAGVITDVVSHLPDNVVTQVIDVGDNFLMPGVIDPHVHINEPGRTGWEGFNTATLAAVAGGVTTVVDMPLNASPVTTTVKAFDEKLAAAKHQLHANCGFWGGIIPGNENEIKGLVEKGVLGFKAFLTHSGIDEFPNVTEADLRKVMPVIAAHGLPLLVHCELSSGNMDERPGEPVVYENYLSSRPPQWENNAIALMIRLCAEYHCWVHIVHLSSAGAIAQIAAAKEEGLPLTVETAQHYLYFNAEDIKDGQTQFKCAPPIRDRANNDLLWEALEQGIIDFVATDHSPSLPEMKLPESGDFIKAWGGIASLQFALPVLWTAARKRNLPVEDVVRWLSTNPSWLTGMQLSKGKIEKGYDADLVVFDPDKQFSVTASIIRHKHKITPYLNEVLYGVVQQTYLGGVKVFDASEHQVNGQEHPSQLTRMHERF